MLGRVGCLTNDLGAVSGLAVSLQTINASVIRLESSVTSLGTSSAATSATLAALGTASAATVARLDALGASVARLDATGAALGASVARLDAAGAASSATLARIDNSLTTLGASLAREADNSRRWMWGFGALLVLVCAVLLRPFVGDSRSTAHPPPPDLLSSVFGARLAQTELRLSLHDLHFQSISQLLTRCDIAARAPPSPPL